MENLITSPIRLMQKASQIEGWDLIPKYGIDLMQEAVDVVEDWSQDWVDGCGFGSSDMTYMIKDYLDILLLMHAFDDNSANLTTVFKPSLSVITRVEKKAHDIAALKRADEQLVEAGIISQDFVTKNPIIS